MTFIGFTKGGKLSVQDTENKRYKFLHPDEGRTYPTFKDIGDYVEWIYQRYEEAPWIYYDTGIAIEL